MLKIIFFFLFVNLLNAVETVEVKESVTINADIYNVCLFVTNPLNDHLWRAEVNSMESTHEQIQVGAVIKEDAWIGIRRNFITVTKLVTYDCPHEAIFVTVKENPFYLKSHRSFSVNQKNETVFTYKVNFDKKMIKETFGLSVPSTLVSSLYSIRMKGYLKKLKAILEK